MGSRPPPPPGTERKGDASVSESGGGRQVKGKDGDSSDTLGRPEEIADAAAGRLRAKQLPRSLSYDGGGGGGGGALNKSSD